MKLSLSIARILASFSMVRSFLTATSVFFDFHFALKTGLYFQLVYFRDVKTFSAVNATRAAIPEGEIENIPEP